MSDWYYAKDGEQKGPVGIGQLRELARDGGLTGKDLVWNTAMKDWTPAGQVEGLFPDATEAPRPAADPANPYAAPLSQWTEAPAPAGPSLPEIIPGSEPIDVGACVKRAFDLTTRNFGMILLIGATYVGVSMGASVGLTFMDSALGLPPLQHAEWQTSEGLTFFARFEQGGSLASSIISNVLSVFLTLGLCRIGLNLVSGGPVALGMLFGEGRKMLRGVVATFLYGLMVAAGIILLIVPGIYLALRYGQYMTAIVDRDLGIMDSFSYSSSITTNNRMNLFLLALMAVAIAIAGCLALVVGLIFAYPVIGLSWMVAYRWMQYGHRAALDQHGTRVPMLAGR